jgi:hypothetical protein
MDGSRRAEPPQIGTALDSLRAAIEVVADGSANRITVQRPDAHRLLPAALQLAKSAGVRVDLIERDTDSEVGFASIAATGR